MSIKIINLYIATYLFVVFHKRPSSPVMLEFVLPFWGRRGPGPETVFMAFMEGAMVLTAEP